MAHFQYLVPKSLDEAVSMHQSHGDQARYIAGGTDVMVKIKEGRIAPRYLISLNHIPDLKFLELDRDTGELKIGAGVTHRMLERSGMVAQSYPVLHDAVTHIGSVQIRNVATIGGNLVNAVPSADGAIPLIVLDATVRIYGPKGFRSVDLIHFFLGPGQTVLETGEILYEIRIPALQPRTGSAYIKFGRRRAMELPLLGVGMLLRLDETTRQCTKCRIGLGVAAPTPMRALQAEKYLVGKEITEDHLREAGRMAAEESRVRDSIRGVAWYRREMVSVWVHRMGLKCLERLGSPMDPALEKG